MAKRKTVVRKRPKVRKQASQPARTAKRPDSARQAASLRRELAHALDRQNASAEVLRAISQSTFDLQAVLDKLTVSAARLCNADMASISQQDATGFHHVTNHGFPADWVSYAQSISLRAGRGSIIGRALIEARVVQVADVLADPEYTYLEPQKKAGYRTYLAVPMLRDGRTIGVLSLCRKTVKPFSAKQIELVASFADQAVIAIENVRLFDETNAALERQTATAAILGVISSSPTDTQPVFDAIVQSGLRLFPDATISIALHRDEQVSAVAVAEPDLARAEAWRNRFPVPLTREYMHSAVILDACVVDIPDMLDAPASMAGRRPQLPRQRLSRRDNHADDARIHRDRRAERRSAGAGSIDRQSARNAEDICGPGGHRHRERSPAERVAATDGRPFRSTRTANGHRRHPAGDIEFARRRGPGPSGPSRSGPPRICEATIVDIFTVSGGTLVIAESVGEFGRPMREGIPFEPQHRDRPLRQRPDAGACRRPAGWGT